MGEHHTEPNHPQSGADPESYFNHHEIPLDTNQKEGDCWHMAQYNQAYSRRVGLVSLDQLPT